MSARRQRAAAVAALAIGFALQEPVALGQPPPTPPDQRSARERAPIDLTGQWVAVVNEDWRWRMVTPPAGDTASIPLNARGREVAEAWDLERDRAEGNLCKAFGPPGGIRQPTRLRLSWADDETLLLQLDAGDQERQLRFTETVPAGPSLQGHSQAQWYRQTQSRGVFGLRTPPEGGSLHVLTTHLSPGYLRPNGVPYGPKATVQEFFNSFSLPDGKGEWLIVTTVVNDPDYLTTELVMSTQFKKEARRAGWNPRPCDIPPPLLGSPAGG